MGELELRYPNGEKVVFDEDYWHWFGEMTIADIHYDGSSTENLPSPYIEDYEQE